MKPSPHLPLALGVLLGVAESCRDVTPIHLETPVAPAAIDDAGIAVDAHGALNDGCIACINHAPSPGPGCGAIVDECRHSPVCVAALECGFRQQCFIASPTAAIASCGRDCAQAGGLTSFDDPAVALLISLLDCVATTCAVACGQPTDAGP